MLEIKFIHKLLKPQFQHLIDLQPNKKVTHPTTLPGEAVKEMKDGGLRVDRRGPGGLAAL